MKIKKTHFHNVTKNWKQDLNQTIGKQTRQRSVKMLNSCLPIHQMSTHNLPPTNVFNGTLHRRHQKTKRGDLFWEDGVYRSSVIASGGSGGSLWPSILLRHFYVIFFPLFISHKSCVWGIKYRLAMHILTMDMDLGRNICWQTTVEEDTTCTSQIIVKHKNVLKIQYGDIPWHAAKLVFVSSESQQVSAQQAAMIKAKCRTTFLSKTCQFAV